MAVYRPRRAAWTTAATVGAVAFVVGLALGAFAASRRGPDVAAAAALMHATLEDSAALLEVVEIESGEARGATAATGEAQGAKGALERSAARFEEVAAPLSTLDAARVARIREGYDEVRLLLEDDAPAAELGPAVAALRADLTGADE